MSNLFKKAVIFNDIHYGLKGNSRAHNQDCVDFVDWMIKEARDRGCDTCFFNGDWHHTRASINVSTLNQSLQSLEKLAKAFSQVFFIPGNHDLYYRDRRDIQSAEWARNIKGITIVNDFFQEGDVAFAEELSKLADCYINDAFGTAHRAHASTTIVAQFFEHKFFGRLLEKEVIFKEDLIKILGERPFKKDEETNNKK